MSVQKESEKRDFVAQTIVIMEQNATVLTDAWFDPANRITQLKTEMVTTDNPEGKQIYGSRQT